MKKLLIIQTDEAYFLFETLQTLKKNEDSLKEYEVTMLVNPSSLSVIDQSKTSAATEITTDFLHLKDKSYDISFNLSLNEESWHLHSEINSSHKIGPYLKNKELVVSDLWSSYLLTIKAKAPFLTFHLQDIYKNILGIKRIAAETKQQRAINTLYISLTNPQTFSAEEQEKFIDGLQNLYSNMKLKDISESKERSRLDGSLYIGPPTLEGLRISENGGQGIFIGKSFQGFNFLPFAEGNHFISARMGVFEANHLLHTVEAILDHKDLNNESPYSVYSMSTENLFGTYLESKNPSDDNYPFYQSHVVLWNFILNLFDTNLEITKCTDSQLELLKGNQLVLDKLLRLHDYAMSSIDIIHNEAKSKETDTQKVQGHLKNLRDMEGISDQIAQSHAFLRPILDFYRIRKAQNFGSSLLDQSQHSFLTYSEEHQALQALEELFSVTLRKNTASI